MSDETIEQFIESWGSLGVLWGINRSMARIHAFLLTSEDPMDLDAIAESLQISKGNASMCLKELRSWGVAHRVPKPGDRRDHYETEPDVWRMLFRIMQERKRREFDPALSTTRQAPSKLDDKKKGPVHERLGQMEEMLSTCERLMRKFLADEQTTRSMLQFMTSSLLGGQ